MEIGFSENSNSAIDLPRARSFAFYGVCVYCVIFDDLI